MKPSSNNVICFGEVLWDILPDASLPGGAPMNVTYHLKKLGENPALITRIGRDEHGEKLVNYFSQSGVSTQYFQVDDQHATGLVYANLNDHHEVAYDIVYPSAWDFIEWNKAYSDLLTQAEFFVYGSLTSRSEVSRNTLYRLLEAAKTKVLDINLRPPHFNRSNVEYLLGKADVLKMNLTELELIAGWFSQLSKIEDRMQLLQEHFNIETLIVTMGGDGALLLDKGIISRHPGFKVQVADTIGSGDAFLAGFLHKRLQGASAQQALVFASALGAFIASHEGGCPAYNVDQIKELMSVSQTIPQ